MYVIDIKNRQSEFAAMKILQEKGLLRSDMIPLVEVIQEKLTTTIRSTRSPAKSFEKRRSARAGELSTEQ